MHDQGAGASAAEVHFASSLTIQTLQAESDKAPFANIATLERVTSEPNITVSFEGNHGAAPTLQSFFYAINDNYMPLTSIDGLSAWDVSNVTGDSCMEYMFSNCGSLTSIDGLSAWDVSNVTGDSCMESMFSHCGSLTSIDGLSAWNVSKVTGDYCMESMFSNCDKLTSLDGLASWDVSSIAGDYCMQFMFFGCSSLTSLDGLSAWDVSNMDGDSCMQSMFSACSSLTSLDGLSAWDVSSVIANSCMNSMFQYCSSLTSLDGLSAWDVSNMDGDSCMYGMFQGCTKLVSLDGIISWDISGVGAATLERRASFSRMFSGCTSLVSIDALSSWEPSDNLDWGQSVSGMFDKCPNLSSITVSSTFRLDKTMFSEGGSLPNWNWWPVDAANPAAVDMNNFVAATNQPATYGYRWQRCVDGASTNPMKDIASADAVSISWDSSQTTLVYTGLLQSAAPVVTIQGETEPLELGRDFYVVYKNSSSSKQTLAIKDVGSYTATIVLRGKYKYSAPVALSTQTITITPLNLEDTVYAPFVYTLPNTFKYTGKEIEPKTMVRLYLREDTNPKDPTKLIPIYCYLVENTDKRPEGDYTVKYANNIDPGTADATVQGVTPAGLSSSNLEGTSTAHFTITGDYIVTFDSNGGSAVEPKEVAAGYPVKKPADPTRDGYNFLYWCTDASLTDEFDFSTPITHDITLYAKWEEAPNPADTITLTFRTEEGSWNGIVETTLAGAPDAAIIAPVYPTVDASRTCIGWFDEAGKEIVSGVTTFGEVTGTVTARFVDTPGWHQNNTGWWYVYDLNNNYYTNCWALINSAWFYFNDAGYCLEYTWGYINGEWYFFGWGGYMQTGWQWIGGSWYFLDRNSGAMKCGWVHDGVWYYCDAALGGAMYDNCWAYINGAWYGFNEGGSMTQGWSYSYAYDGWFYLDPETGHMLYGWQYIGGHWYYFYDNGLMAVNTYVGIYWLGSDGAMW